MAMKFNLYDEVVIKGTIKYIKINCTPPEPVKLIYGVVSNCFGGETMEWFTEDELQKFEA